MKKITAIFASMALIISAFAVNSTAFAEKDLQTPASIKDAGKQLSFETADLDGNPVSSEDLFSQNEITMLYIWEPTCDQCIAELKELSEINKRLQEDNCGVVGLLMDGGDSGMIEKGKTILADNNADYLNLTPPEDFEDMLTITGHPTSLMIDSDGVILTGVTGDHIDWYESAIQKLLAGEQPELPEVETEEDADNSAKDESATEAEPSSNSADSDGTEASGASAYRVLVYDADGNPVEGVMVQFCSADMCTVGQTDAEGISVFDMPAADDYTVHLLQVPEGYEPSDQEYEMPDAPGDLSVTINKAG